MNPIEEVLAELEEEYLGKRELIVTAYEIVDKVSPLLPAGWTALLDAQSIIELSFASTEKAPVEEFRLVRNIVSKAAGNRLETGGYQTSTGKASLTAKCYIYHKDDRNKVFMIVAVQSFDTEGCQMVPYVVPESVGYKIGPGCLSDPAEEVKE